MINIYWITTFLLSLLYLVSAVTYIIKNDWVKKNIISFGYPPYLVPLLTLVKILAVIAIISRVSVMLSDLAYAGMLFHLILSGLAHIGVRKPRGAIPAVIGVVLLVTSFSLQNTARSPASPYGLFSLNHVGDIK